MADAVGQADLRAETVSAVVQGFALQEYRMKQLLMVTTSTSWKESYYKETATELTGGLGSNVKGVPRLANFPYGEVSWTLTSSYHVKFGMDAYISYEDAKTNEIDVVARTLLRIARAISSAVDLEIYSKLSADTGNTLAASATWDSAVIADRDPIQDVLNAMKLIQEDNYDPYQNGYLLLSPKDFANFLGNANVRNAGQFWTADVTKNGRVGMLLGLTIVVSNSVTADEAMVCVAKECGSWKSACPLTTDVEYEAGVKYRIRAWEIGVTQVTNPNAICTITNTQA